MVEKQLKGCGVRELRHHGALAFGRGVDRRSLAFPLPDKLSREVDIVLESASGEIAGVEVKAGATVSYDDLGGLQRLRDKLGDRFKCGVVLYTGERTLPFGDRIWVVPLAALWS